MRALVAATLLTCLALWTSATSAEQPRSAPASTSPRAAQSAPTALPSQQSQPSAVAQQVRPTPSPREPSTYSADNLYNLANSYARAGKPGLAVLNYERAALLAPNDPDIRANLDYVRATAQVPTDPPTRFTRFARAANPTAAAWLGVIGLALLGTSLLASKATPRFRFLWATSALLGTIQIALAISSALLLRPRMHEAVVLINQTPARVSPVLMGDTAFILREAETVTMTAQHEDFVLIRTHTGRTGWVARANVSAVIP
jgi:hypothetical protein